MPTQITSSGITFNDATSLTSANIAGSQIANGSITADKLGTNEQKQICKAWVNFNGVIIAGSSANFENGGILTPTNGGNTVNWYSPAGGWVNTNTSIGVIITLPTIGGSSSGSLGGVPCSQLYLQLQSITNSNNAILKLVNSNGSNTSTVFTSSATVTGNGTSTGATYLWTGIRSSYNVSSVTKNGTGDYTVNFTTAMADANYSISVSAALNTNAPSVIQYQDQSTSSVREIVRVNSSAYDPTHLSMQVFGN